MRSSLSNFSAAACISSLSSEYETRLFDVVAISEARNTPRNRRAAASRRLRASDACSADADESLCVSMMNSFKRWTKLCAALKSHACTSGCMHA
eukprot:6200586-Pleurochrysis_carterae.AAC.2